MVPGSRPAEIDMLISGRSLTWSLQFWSRIRIVYRRRRNLTISGSTNRTSTNKTDRDMAASHKISVNCEVQRVIDVATDFRQEIGSGSFAGGFVRASIHIATLTLPTSPRSR